MAARALSDLKNALVKQYTVKNGSAIVAGKRIKFGASDTEIDVAGANDDLAFGTALETKTGNAAGTVQCTVVLDGFAIVPMLVGTGGATRGTNQVQAADGVTDMAGSGVTNAKPPCGRAMQSGVVGDLIGVLVGGPSRATTA